MDGTKTSVSEHHVDTDSDSELQACSSYIKDSPLSSDEESTTIIDDQACT